ncbi:oxidized low-density lipoprotein receptor 1 isoform X4 [Kryptolebias marmoratus]|uniref:oxidized low-density lipoprotein receptor 1 isoform X4 n=1 Tax=Kryptolebias marmoratus TaxID=37003 RepID=UPI0007F8CEAA|nr:oxidized low-density lipoprotein receptor 1 isoform X4 [Kryptolebias marmoratus]
MDEECNYSALVFKNKAAAQKDEKEDLTTSSGKKAEESVATAQNKEDDQTIYSEVKSKKQVTTAPQANEDLMIYAKVKPKTAAAKASKREELINDPEVKQEEAGTAGPRAGPAAKCPTSLMILGTLCVLLVAGVIVLSVTLIVVMNQQEAKINDLRAKNEKLIEGNKNLTRWNQEKTAENNELMNEAQKLTEERDNLTWTMEVILTFDSFPVKDFCPNKKCQPCQNSWIQFQEKCYLFYKEAAPWKTWEQSRQFCQNKSADLVVVDDLQEQEFVSNHLEPYFSRFHGYWLGLRQVNNIWVWVDGHNDTLGFWVTEEISATGPYVLMMPKGPDKNLKLPERNLTQTWDKGDHIFELRFICERKALIKPN